MRKTFVIINLFVLVLIILANIFQFYFIQFPLPFNFEQATKDAEWTYVLGIISCLAIFSLVIGFLKIKLLDFQRVFLCFNILFLVFIIYFSLDRFLAIKKEISDRINEYTIKAQQDIKNDNVTFEYSGGLAIISDNQRIINKTDSIHKKYGIKYKNMGCIIFPTDEEVQTKYSETVAPYLEKRNGKNWESKMNAEIEEMRKNNMDL